MKISERIALLKAGYTKDEINTMIDEDASAPAAQDPVPEEPAADQALLKVMSALANEVKDLKTAVYKQNIADSEAQNGGQLRPEDILASLINPPSDDRKEK